MTIPSPTDLLGNLIGSAVDSVTGFISDALPFEANELINPDSLPDDFTLDQKKYDFTRRVFPSDLEHADTYNGHYMVININKQENSRLNSVNDQTVFTPANGGNELSKTDALRYKIDKNFKNADGVSMQQKIGSRPRFTRRIVESIALYMPNSELTFTDLHEFDNVSLTKFAGSVAGGVAKFVGSIGVGALLGSKAGSVAGNLIGAVGDNIGNIAQLVGSPLNPKVEVIFSNTFQREFSFEFRFAPANEKESIALEQIIRTIRFHAAPELRPGALESFFYLPPSEFDITFFYRGEENTKLPRLNTCVLTQVDISYAPTGAYATFHNGHPVSVRMMLRFRETEVVHKLRVLQGF